MKIIIGTESFAPNISGVAISTELLAENLARAGHRVYVFSPSRKFQTGFNQDFKNYQVLQLRSIKNPFRKGFRVAFLAKREIINKVAEINPDLIHLQDPTSICSALKKAGQKFKIPIVITNHFSLEYILSYINFLKPIHKTVRIILMRYLANFYNQCDFVFCPTETVKADLIKWGVKTKIEAISNGVDLERFFSYSAPLAIRLKYHLPLNPIVLYVGRIDKDKNLEILINSVPKIIKSIEAHFVIVGSGDSLPGLKKLADKLGIQKEVSFLGWINHDSSDFPVLYELAELFVIPSAIETQSIVTLEAMASGLPIVASNAGALPELVQNNKNGFLVPPNEPHQFAQKILEILNNKKMRQKMSKESLKIVSSHQISESFQKIIKNYEQVIKNY